MRTLTPGASPSGPLRHSSRPQVGGAPRALPASCAQWRSFYNSGGAVEASALPGPLDSRELVFYTHTLCPYAQRVWLALLEKGVEHALVHVDLSRKPPWFRALNPAALVPCVSLGGAVFTESADVCRWLDKQFDGPELIPSDAKSAAICKSCLARVDSLVSSGLALVAASDARSWGVGRNAPRGVIKAFEAECTHLSKALADSGGPFLAGERVSLADVMCWPFMERFALCALEFSGYDVRGAMGGAFARWFDAMSERESCRVTGPDREQFLQALRQHRSLDFFDYETFTAFQLHRHLTC